MDEDWMSEVEVMPLPEFTISRWSKNGLTWYALLKTNPEFVFEDFARIVDRLDGWLTRGQAAKRLSLFVDNGYVERVKYAYQGRKSLYSLTPKGMAYWRRFREILSEGKA